MYARRQRVFPLPYITMSNWHVWIKFGVPYFSVPLVLSACNNKVTPRHGHAIVSLPGPSCALQSCNIICNANFHDFHLLIVHYVKRKLWKLLTSELISFRNSENQDWSLKRTSSLTEARLKTEDEYQKCATRCALCLISELLSTPYFTQRRLFYFVAKCSNLRKLLRFYFTFARQENSDPINT